VGHVGATTVTEPTGAHHPKRVSVEARSSPAQVRYLSSATPRPRLVRRNTRAVLQPSDEDAYHRVYPDFGVLGFPCKEAPRMARVRLTDVQTRSMEFLDVTSLTLEALQQLVPPCEAAFQAHLAA